MKRSPAHPAFYLILLFLVTFFFQEMPDSALANGGDSPGHKHDTWSFGDYHPLVEGNYGVGTARHKRLTGEFEDFGFIEAKLGYSRIKIFRKYVQVLDERYLMGNLANRDVQINESRSDSLKVQVEMIRLGGGKREGYGYKMDFISLFPYHQAQITLSRLQSVRPNGLSLADRDIFDRYEDSFRWGTSTEGGIKLLLFESLSFTAGYETAVIYPRIVFFKWLGGAIVQTVIVEAVSHFAEDIVDRSGLLGPVMYAVLRNGAAYGMYVAMRDKMNWPFNSETPLTYEILKFGVSIQF